MKKTSGETAKQEKAGGGFTTLKSRTIRYNNNTQFIRVAIQKIGKRKFLSVSRGYRNKGNADIIKATITVSYEEIADKIAQQLNDLKKELPSIKKTTTKTQKKGNEDMEIRI